MRAIDCHLRMRCAKMQLHAMAIVEFFQTPEIFEFLQYEFEFTAFSNTTIDRHLRMRGAKMQLHAMAIVEFFQTPEIFETMHYEFEFPAFSSTTTDICSRAVTK